MPCPASTKLMRTSRSGQWTTTVGATAVELVPFDPNRVALLIPSSTVGDLWLGLRSTPSSLHGMRIPSGAIATILTLGDHGALVQGPIQAVVDGGTDTITCWDSSVGPIQG